MIAAKSSPKYLLIMTYISFVFFFKKIKSSMIQKYRK